MIKQKKSPFEEGAQEEIKIPDPNYILKPDDTLVLFGTDDRIASTESWD